mgnify:CR=1 FL=1
MINKLNRAFIFDLDGVITETSEYHYMAWKTVCKKIGYDLTRKKNEELKGVNRKKCLDMIMEWGNIRLSEKEIESLLEAKNKIYKDYIKDLNENDVCEGVLNFINDAIKNNIKIALYSASRNAKRILCQLKIIDLFTVIIDGNNVSNAKPDPEGFKIAADLTKTNAKDCVVLITLCKLLTRSAAFLLKCDCNAFSISAKLIVSFP